MTRRLCPLTSQSLFGNVTVLILRGSNALTEFVLRVHSARHSARRRRDGRTWETRTGTAVPDFLVSGR